jgi:hypothetical protein
VDIGSLASGQYDQSNKNIIMPSDNRVSAEITDSVKAEVLAKFQEIKALLPFLINLSTDEKRAMTSIGTERGAMDQTFHTEMAAHPDFVPSYVDPAELAKDRELRHDLLEILQAAREVTETLEDTAYAAGSDVLLAYLAFYSNAKQAAKRGVPGASTLIDNLSRFFPNTRRNPSVPQAS